MIQKIVLGIFVGMLVGIFTTSFFLPLNTPLVELFWTKITATSMVTGLFCGIYAHLSKSKLQVFLISIIIGMLTFFLKYLITGHHFDPLTMGAFVGALLGGAFAIYRKIVHGVRTYNRLEKLRKKGFNNYG